MSFTSVVKNEISKLEYKEIEMISLLSSIVVNNYHDEQIIKITTENASVARIVFNCFKKLYKTNPKITIRKGYNFNKNLIYILEITNDVYNVLKDLGIKDHNSLNFITDDEQLKAAYISGLFLTTGSINDPKTSRYHLEFLVETSDYALFIKELLNYYHLNSKILKRENKYMIYVKEAEKIGDFLRIVKSINSLLYYEDIRIYRDHKNMTNRLNNCEQANVDKIIKTSDQQLKEIKIIEDAGMLELLDEKIIELISYRKKYIDASLSELAEIITLETSKYITKSGLNHRFKKIRDIAAKILEKQQLKDKNDIL
ncbi:MAG: DNA-binding protein WhiA [Mycoplasmatota bacterium]